MSHQTLSALKKTTKQNKTTAQNSARKQSEAKPTSAPKVRRVARELGYDHLRPGQQEAVQSVLSGRDTLAVMPTGSGKSAIYQIAAKSLQGVALVISPLIALQRDQADHLSELNECATVLNSTLSSKERAQVLQDLADCTTKFLFLAPEQLANEETVAALRAIKPTLMVVDEAHCVSEWGHDFRPEYLELGRRRVELGNPLILALTATAAPPVRREIVERLGMYDPNVLVRGFDRPNIFLEVRHFESGEKGQEARRVALLDAVIEAVERGDKPGLVYAPTRALAEELSAALIERDIDAVHYHAGLKGSERESVQASFMAGERDVIVATVAFGMGIDKADVRWVFHAALSDSLDSYYQELGRAGRDGEPARATLFVSPDDFNLQRFFAGAGKLAVEEIEQTVAMLRSLAAHNKVTPHELCEVMNLSNSKVTSALQRLEDAGAVETLEDGTLRLNARMKRREVRAEVAEEAAQAQATQRKFARSRIEMMGDYATATTCRREFLLAYFGETFQAPCDSCDICCQQSGELLTNQEGTASARSRTTPLKAMERAGDRDKPFELGARVRHPKLGEGQVLRYEDDKITVLFDESGYATLALDLVTTNGLLSIKISAASNGVFE